MERDEKRWCLASVSEMLTDVMQAVALNELVDFGRAKALMVRTGNEGVAVSALGGGTEKSCAKRVQARLEGMKDWRP